MTTVAEVDTPPTNTEPVKADAEVTKEERLKYRALVHVGQDAIACSHANDGKCAEQGHFHAVCRLPNGFQVRDIAEKSQAARARRARMYRDPQSDVSVVLEEELESMRGVPKEILVDEILDRDFTETFGNATREVHELDDPDHVPEGDEPVRKLYENIAQDREEYLRQRDLTEEQRGEDFGELETTYANYSRDIETAMDRIAKPRRDHLLEQDEDALLEIIRRARVEQKCLEAYLHSYGSWQMFVCTYKTHPTGKTVERMWPSIESMKFQEDPQVIDAVKTAFEDLEAAMARSRAGKA